MSLAFLDRLREARKKAQQQAAAGGGPSSAAEGVQGVEELDEITVAHSGASLTSFMAQRQKKSQLTDEADESDGASRAGGAMWLTLKDEEDDILAKKRRLQRERLEGKSAATEGPAPSEVAQDEYEVSELAEKERQIGLKRRREADDKVQGYGFDSAAGEGATHGKSVFGADGTLLSTVGGIQLHGSLAGRAKDGGVTENLSDHVVGAGLQVNVQSGFEVQDEPSKATQGSAQAADKGVKSKSRLMGGAKLAARNKEAADAAKQRRLELLNNLSKRSDLAVADSEPGQPLDQLHAGHQQAEEQDPFRDPFSHFHGGDFTAPTSEGGVTLDDLFGGSSSNVDAVKTEIKEESIEPQRSKVDPVSMKKEPVEDDKQELNVPQASLPPQPTTSVSVGSQPPTVQPPQSRPAGRWGGMGSALANLIQSSQKM